MSALAARERKSPPGRTSPVRRRPAAARTDPRPVAAQAAQSPPRRRVLVVDDESSMRLLCRVNLGLGGFDVTEAADGASALRAAQLEDFALVILDVMMPDMSGHEVAERLSRDERTRDLPIVFFSARASRDDLRAGFELGAVDYITKPFDVVALAPWVEEILARVERGEAEWFRQAKLSELSE